MRGQWEAVPAKAPADNVVRPASGLSNCETAQGERCADSDWSCIYGQPSSGLLSRPFADERQAATLVDELEAPKLD